MRRYVNTSAGVDNSLVREPGNKKPYPLDTLVFGDTLPLEIGFIDASGTPMLFPAGSVIRAAIGSPSSLLAYSDNFAISGNFYTGTLNLGTVPMSGALNGQPFIQSTFELESVTAGHSRTWAQVQCAITNQLMDIAVQPLDLPGGYAATVTLDASGAMLVGKIAALSGYVTGTSATKSSLDALSGYAAPAQANYVFTTGVQTIFGNKTFLGTTYVENLVVTGTRTIVNTSEFDVASNWITLNATGGARDAGLFISTGFTGANNTGAVLGFDVPSNRWVVGVQGELDDMGRLLAIATTGDVAAASGVLALQISAAAGVLGINGATGLVLLSGAPANSYIRVSQSGATTFFLSGIPNPTFGGNVAVEGSFTVGGGGGASISSVNSTFTINAAGGGTLVLQNGGGASLALSPGHDGLFERNISAKSGIFLADTGNYTPTGVASIAQLLGASGWLTNSATSNVVYTTGNQTINGVKTFAGSGIFSSSTSRVGINTTTPSGRLSIRGGSAGNYVEVEGSNRAWVHINSDNSSAPVFAIGGDGTADLVNVFDGPTEVFTILDGGNVGIGTPAPSAKLDVSGSTRIVADNDALNLIQSSQSSGVGIRFFAMDSVGENRTAKIRWVPAASSNSYLAFQTNGTSDNNAVAIREGGSVGFGTTSPADRLHVVSVAGGGLRVENTGNNQSAELVAGSSTISLGARTSTPLVFIMANSEVARLNTAGNLGIGTDNPGARLHVSGGNIQLHHTQPSLVITATNGAANGQAKMDIVNTAGTFRIGRDIASAGSMFVGGGAVGNAAQIGTRESTALQFFTSDTARVTVLSDGKVGIGTTGAQQLLHVSGGNIRVDGSFFLTGGALISGSSTFGPLYASTAGLAAAVRINALGSAENSLILGDEFTDNYYTFNIPASKRLSINGGGSSTDGVVFESTMFVGMGSASTNVGVGFLAPTQKLHVSGGNLRVENGAAMIVSDLGSGLSVMRSGVESQKIDLIPADSSISVLLKGGGNSKPFYIASNGAQSLHFGTNYQAGLGEVRMTITTGGSVGIGLTNPAYKLEVSGSFGATTKSFDIQHPTRGAGWRLAHGVIEGDAHRVYQDGRSQSNEITLPAYWSGLVHPESVTVQLTPYGRHQNLFVESADNLRVQVGNHGTGSLDYYYWIVGERADVDHLAVEVQRG